MLANFDSRLHLPEPNRSVKSIVDPSRVELRLNEHWFQFEGGAPTVDEHHQPLETWSRPGELTFDLLRINHYFSKSEQEAMAKFDRPQAGGGKLQARAEAQGTAQAKRAPRPPGRRDPAVPPLLEKELEGSRPVAGGSGRWVLDALSSAGRSRTLPRSHRRMAGSCR